MVKLHAEDIQCTHCTGRIEKALKKQILKLKFL